MEHKLHAKLHVGTSPRDAAIWDWLNSDAVGNNRSEAIRVAVYAYINGNLPGETTALSEDQLSAHFDRLFERLSTYLQMPPGDNSLSPNAELEALLDSQVSFFQGVGNEPNTSD